MGKAQAQTCAFFVQARTTSTRKPEMMKPVIAMLTAAACLAGAAAPKPPTDVLLFFDTEDYTCDRSNDAIRDIANILTAENVRGHFMFVGFLAQRLMEYRRYDVIDSMKGHVIGSQSLYHTLHPDICEMTDVADYKVAHDRILAQEATCVGMLRAVFGRDSIDCFVPPGNSVTYAGMAACTDLGMKIYGAAGFADFPVEADNPAYGTGGLARRDNKGKGLWYFNMLQLPYSSKYQLEGRLLPRKGAKPPDYAEILDGIATHDLTILYMHPHMVVKTRHWDGINYRYETKAPWRKWEEAPDRPAGDTAIFYERFRELVRRLKADARFRLTDIEQIIREIPERRTMHPADIPRLKASLERKLGPVVEPAPYCVADVFQAAVKFLGGATAHDPGRVWGFLEKPYGIEAPVAVKAADVRAAARRIDLSTFLPSSFDVGGVKIGPADMLFAMLETLCGKDEITLSPREQLGTFEEVPTLERFRINDHWCHSKDFRDDYLSDRLRWQLWTMYIN